MDSNVGTAGSNTTSIIGPATTGQAVPPFSAAFIGGIGTATSASDLNELITAADQQISPATLTIDITGLIALDTLPAVANGESLTVIANIGTVTMLTAVPDIAAINLHNGVSLVINGSGNATLDGGNTVRGLFAYAGNLTVNNLTIQNTVALGGAGANAGFAGGGGAGLGGGLFVGSSANVTLNGVSFANTKAIGGSGGNNTGGGAAGWGGGGGLGGNAGIVFGGMYFSGGGGVGRTAFGGTGSNQANPYTSGNDGTGQPGAGIIVGGASGGNGAPITATNDPHTGGAIYGGGGGLSSGTGHNVSFPSPSHYYGAGSGGGGVGGHNGYSKIYGDNSPKAAGGGGMGGFGGGGGAGYYYGGFGGFGGGAGAGQYSYGGNGGFGGGGGGMPNKAGTLGLGGFGAGKAGGGAGIGNGRTPQYALSGGDSGGGGLGAGGAVFVQSGGVLTFGRAGLVTLGTVTGGAGGVPTGTDGNGAGTEGTAGSGFGSGIFIQNDSTSVAQAVTFAPGSGETLTVTGVIADEAGSGGHGQNATLGAVVMSGAGNLLLSASNTFSGGLIINSGTVEIASGASPGAGTIDFATTAGVSSATLQIDGAAAPTNVISHFISGDAIDLHGIAFKAGDIPNYTTATGELDIIRSGVTVASLFFGAGNQQVNDPFHLNQEIGSTGIVVTNDVPCFLTGTSIQTDRGSVRVERLAVGDRVLTLSGDFKPITWIGTGCAPVTPAQRTAATPIIVRKGALSNNVPYRDLYITKGHALYVDGVLVPVEFLVNHRSIQYDDRTAQVTFYHIELADHAVIFAEGAPAESYRDDGNRGLFSNVNPAWDEPLKLPCAPVLTGGPIVDDLWRHLLDRSGPRPGFPITDDPDLHLLCDGERIDGLRALDRVVFALPRRPRTLRLASRASSPVELGLARDPRQLGVAVKQLQLWQGQKVFVAEAEANSLVDGYHGYEPENGHRWTNGNAAVPPELFTAMNGPGVLAVLLGSSTKYLDDGHTVHST